MPDDEGWVRVGSVSVESGRCLVVDPAYLRDGFSGAEEVDAAITAAESAPSGAAPLSATEGVEIGAVVGTVFGDDVYPVEVRYETEGGVPRVAELRVRFVAGPRVGW